MKVIQASTAEDLEAFEADLWVGGIRDVARSMWNGRIKNVKSRKSVRVAEATDKTLNDRSSFPLFGYRNGELNTESGFTLRWDVARQSKLDSKFYMISPVGSRVFGKHKAVLKRHPKCREVDIDPEKHWPGEGP